MIKVIYITDATRSGRGDYDYLQALSSKQYLEKFGLKDVDIKRIVCIPYNNDSLLTASGDVKKEFVNKEVHTIVYQAWDEVMPRLSKMFTEDEFAAADVIVGVSTEHIEAALSEYKSIYMETQCFFIGAHSSKLRFIRDDNIKEYQIGPRDGFLMDGIVSPNKIEERIAALSAISDPHYMGCLLRGKDVTTFLARTLFVPAYLQHPEHVQLFVDGVVDSKLVESYPDGLTFHLSLHEAVKKEKYFTSPEAMFNTLFADKIEQLKAKGYTDIIIDGFDSGDAKHPDHHVHLQDVPSGGTPKTLRIIANRWMKNKSDFERLFGAAQIIAGTSGDNSFNNALAKGVIPYYCCQPWNTSFVDTFNNGVIDCIKKIQPQLNEATETEIRTFFARIMPYLGFAFDYSQDTLRDDSVVSNQYTFFLEALNGLNQENLDLIKHGIEYMQTNRNFDTTMQKLIDDIKEGIEMRSEPEAASGFTPT